MATAKNKKKVSTKVAAAKPAGPKAASKLNKDEALAELAVLGKELEFTNADGSPREYTDADSLADLRKAVADGRKALAAPAVGAAEEEGDEPEAPATPAKPGDSVDVIAKAGSDKRYVRTFNAELHGDDFLEVAKEFVAKQGGEIVPSASIKGLKVRWEEKDEDTGVVTPRYEFFRGTGHNVKNEALGLARTNLGSCNVMSDDELKKLEKTGKRR